MLEAEVAFLTSVHQLMDVVEASVRSMAKHLTQSGASQGGAIWEQKHELTRQRLASLTETSSSSSWKRITYTQAVDILQAHWAAASADSSLPPPFYAPPPAWGQALGSSHEKWLAGVWAEGPLFVHDYPAAIKSFYMLPSNAAIEDGSGERRFVEESPDEAGERPTVACFDLLVPGMGELAGGSLREHRLESLLAVMQCVSASLLHLTWIFDVFSRTGSARCASNRWTGTSTRVDMGPSLTEGMAWASRGCCVGSRECRTSGMSSASQDGRATVDSESTCCCCCLYLPCLQGGPIFSDATVTKHLDHRVQEAGR